MNFTKINELKPYDLNCNIFDVYSYDGLSMQELLCQFFTKINECIKTSNETIDLAEWLVNEGLKQEVAIKLTNWLNDGTLENLINVTLFENLNKKIDNVSSQSVTLFENLNKKIDNVSSQLEHIEKNQDDLCLNVVDYKEHNDTDYTNAFKKCVEMLSGKGGRIFVPQGVYYVDEIILESNIELFGVGFESRIILNAYRGNHLIRLKDATQHHITIRNLELDGNKDNQTAENDIINLTNETTPLIPEDVDHYHVIDNVLLQYTKGNGLYTHSGRECIFNRVIARRCDKAGINIGGSDNFITNCTSYTNTYGFTGNNHGSNLKFSNNKAFYNTDDFYFINLGRSIFSNNESQSPKRHNFYLENVYDTSFVNALADSGGRENDTGVGFYLKTCNKLKIHGIATHTFEGNMKGYVEKSGGCRFIDVDLIVNSDRENGLIKHLYDDGHFSHTNRFKFNGQEIHYNNIIQFNKVNSIKGGTLENWTKGKSEGANGEYLFDGLKQTLNITSNNSTKGNYLSISSPKYPIGRNKKISIGVNYKVLKDTHKVRLETRFYNANGDEVGSPFYVTADKTYQNYLNFDNYTVPYNNAEQVSFTYYFLIDNTNAELGYCELYNFNYMTN